MKLKGIYWNRVLSDCILVADGNKHFNSNPRGSKFTLYSYLDGWVAHREDWRLRKVQGFALPENFLTS